MRSWRVHYLLLAHLHSIHILLDACGCVRVHARVVEPRLLHKHQLLGLVRGEIMDIHARGDIIRGVHPTATTKATADLIEPIVVNHISLQDSKVGSRSGDGKKILDRLGGSHNHECTRWHFQETTGHVSKYCFVVHDRDINHRFEDNNYPDSHSRC